MLRLLLIGVLLVFTTAALALSTGSRLLIFMALVLTTLVLLVYWWFRRSLPAHTGTLQLKGLRAPVEVHRDERGVPHIYASSLQDLYMAQGYITAQDRLWSMDIIRRTASGLMAEILGPRFLDADKHMRTVGLRRAANASYQTYSPEALQYLAAYAAGVNARMTTSPLPPEFPLLGYRPAPWTVQDSLTISKFMAYTQSHTWAGKLLRTRLVQTVGAEKAVELFETAPDMNFIKELESISLPNFDELLVQAEAALHERVGINSWVVAGQKTASGAPILANAPDLPVRHPCTWYQAHLISLDGMDVIGATYPGVPGIVHGHNREIAWGINNTSADVQDLYMEQIHPTNPDLVAFGGAWEAATRIREEIPVKGYVQPVVLEVQITRHGPVLASGSSMALALRWTGLEPTTEWESLLAINRAGSWQEFLSALKHHRASAQTFLLAARNGTVGAKVGGRIPIRPRGESQWPIPGWTGANEWSGFEADTPESVNPPEGYISSLMVDAGGTARYRGQRLGERLQHATNLNAEKMGVIQAEQVNLQARALLQIMLNAVEEGLRQGVGAQLEPLSDVEKHALLLVTGWDCTEAPEAAEPILWHQWHLFTLEGIFRPQLGLALFDQFVSWGNPDAVIDRLLANVTCGNASLWLEAEGDHSLGRIVLRAFRRAVAYLVAKLGPQPERWRWGKEHRIRFEHLLASRPPALKAFLDLGPYPVGGSGPSVSHFGYSPLHPYEVQTAATWRQIVDLAHLEESREICAPGQSEHLFCLHHNDQVSAWLKGETYPHMYRHAQIRQLPCLQLRPTD